MQIPQVSGSQNQYVKWFMIDLALHRNYRVLPRGRMELHLLSFPILDLFILGAKLRQNRIQNS